jgi:endonuclease/exonuclease/phosphatase family metal-dependent hydrolase
MANRFALPILLIAGAVAVSACRSIDNYTEPNEPLFTGSYAEEPPVDDGILKAVSWNIAFSEEIETAIEELRQVEELASADIILLQEMDETGVEEVARELGYNYIYFPASVHSRHDRNFGNAILSKWPLTEPNKLVLPHTNPRNDQIRIATHAIAEIDDRDVHIYSVHTETYWLGQDEREEQINALLEDLPAGEEIIIVGGDFNTLTPGSVTSLVEHVEEADLDRGGADTGPTVGIGRVGLTLDHIFTRGLSELDAGVWSKTEASDHNPLWVDFALE